MKTDGEGNYVLKQHFSIPFLDLLAEEFELRVILPEGSTDIRTELPFPIDSQSTDVTFNYLDTAGSPTIIYRKKNLIDFHNQFILVRVDGGRVVS